MEGEIKRLKYEIYELRDELSRMQDYLLNESYYFRCSYCRKVRYENTFGTCSVGHRLCIDDDIEDKCPKCTEIQTESTKKAIVALLLCLKQKDCHKDI